MKKIITPSPFPDLDRLVYLSEDGTPVLVEYVQLAPASPRTCEAPALECNVRPQGMTPAVCT